MTRSAGISRRQCLKALCLMPLAAGLVPAAAHATLSAPRVAALSWAGAQILMALGIAPMAMTERDNYFSSGSLPALPNNVIELGLHIEPNLELLQQLEPDLIVIDPDQRSLVGRLRIIAPTVTVDIYDARRGGPYARAVAETQRIGALLGRERQARAHLTEVEARLAACEKTVNALGALFPVLICDLYDDGRHLYLYGPNSMPHDVLDRLGVRNAWDGSTTTGFLLLGIEELASMTDAQVFYINRGVGNRIALHNLGQSVLWEHLPFVKAGRLSPLPGFFTYGATACAAQFATELTAALGRSAGHD